TQRNASLPDNWRMVRPSSSHIARFSALSLSGRFSVTVAMAPSRVVRMESVVMAVAARLWGYVLLLRDFGIPHDFCPFFGFGLQISRELGAGRGFGVHALCGVALLQLCAVQRGDNGFVEFVDNRFGRARRRQHTVPGGIFKAGY